MPCWKTPHGQARRTELDDAATEASLHGLVSISPT